MPNYFYRSVIKFNDVEPMFHTKNSDIFASIFNIPKIYKKQIYKKWLIEIN